MKKMIITSLITAVVSTSAMASSIEGTGSSFQYPANKAWAAQYYKLQATK